MPEDKSATREKGRIGSQGIQSVEIGYSVLTALANARGPIGLSSLAKMLNMPAAKVHRYVASLVRCGLIVQERFMGEYDLGPSALLLGVHAIRRLDPHQIVYEETKRLSEKVNHGVLLHVWTNAGPVVIAHHHSERPLALLARVGIRMPVIYTATGRVFLTFGHEAELPRFWKDEFNPASPPLYEGKELTLAGFRGVIADIRQRGMARTKSALTAGIDAIAAPVFDMWGRSIMVVSVIGSADDLNVSWKGEPASELQKTTSNLSEQLGYLPPLEASAGAV